MESDGVCLSNGACEPASQRALGQRVSTIPTANVQSPENAIGCRLPPRGGVNGISQLSCDPAIPAQSSTPYHHHRLINNITAIKAFLPKSYDALRTAFVVPEGFHRHDNAKDREGSQDKEHDVTIVTSCASSDRKDYTEVSVASIDISHPAKNARRYRYVRFATPSRAGCCRPNPTRAAGR